MASFWHPEMNNEYKALQVILTAWANDARAGRRAATCGAFAICVNKATKVIEEGRWMLANHSEIWPHNSELSIFKRAAILASLWAKIGPFVPKPGSETDQRAVSHAQITNAEFGWFLGLAYLHGGQIPVAKANPKKILKAPAFPSLHCRTECVMLLADERVDPASIALILELATYLGNKDISGCTDDQVDP